ncbi:hypothetical protein CEXT_78691 [Caerostris extrusa]|uniref:Uncharacterized protein n=1 Tax=Caerostris extrusa TaxID=172846 RepID=A0AAV4NST6_CAEEX|nr:hypothetical protein CEXT_78691 [Caerostris extrusa]
MEMAHTMRTEGFEDFAEADIVQLMTDNELDEDDSVGMVNYTNDRDRGIPKIDPNEEEREPVAFTAKIILGLELRAKIG